PRTCHRDFWRVAARGELRQGVTRLQTFRLECGSAFGAHGADGDRTAPLPAALLDEVIGHRGEYIVEIAEQVDPAIAIAVDRIVAVAGRHELAPAHRPGVAALERGDVETVFLAHREQLRQVVAEKVLAV